MPNPFGVTGGVATLDPRPAYGQQPASFDIAKPFFHIARSVEERTTGLILRTRPLTESSLIVHWLTSDLGRIATVAKGARRPKSPFRGKLDLFYSADLTFRRSARSELHALLEVSVRDFHAPLREELGYLHQAAYFVRLLEQTTETDTPLPALFQLFAQALDALPKQPPQPLVIYTFEMKLLSELGLRPSFAEGPLSGGARQILERLLTLDWASLSRLKLSPAQNSEIDRYLFQFLSRHLGKVPSGRREALIG